MNGKPVYDDDIFFSKYAQMDRSLLGLSGAGEWNTLEKLLPDFKGKRVLDLGCGYGWHAAWMAEKGAAGITAVDVSVKMLEKAKSMHTDSRIEYILEDIESFDAAPSSYDIVFSSLVFHYVMLQITKASSGRSDCGSMKKECSFLLSSIPFSLHVAIRTGSTTAMAAFHTSLSTITITKENALRCFSARKSESTTEVSQHTLRLFWKKVSPYSM